jgi:5-methyltetrahydropteroyltriglutamate--homocysteine methyltransferase
LKTRGWPETEAALANMVEAAKALRAKLAIEALSESAVPG